MATSPRGDRPHPLAAHLHVVKASLYERIDPGPCDRDFWVRQAVYNYVSALSLTLARDPRGFQPLDLDGVRRGSLRVIAWARERAATAGDIIHLLGQVTDVPPELQELIREDVAGLLACG